MSNPKDKIIDDLFFDVHCQLRQIDEVMELAVIARDSGENDAKLVISICALIDMVRPIIRNTVDQLEKLETIVFNSEESKEGAKENE